MMISSTPRVSIIVPCRNEERFIAECLDSILANDFPHAELEILVVDGNSTDRTREIVGQYALRHSCVQLLDNPRQTTPVALNIGLRHARGELLIRMDAHAKYDPAYVVNCVRAADEYGADNVGGRCVMVPRHDTLLARALVQAMSHPFGVGNATYRTTTLTEPRWVDTVPFFCFRRAVVDRVGYFNEWLTRSQDFEFSQRLHKLGGRTLMVPGIVSYYYLRTDLGAFVRRNVLNGVWVIVPFLYTDVIPVRIRHLVPLTFVLTLLTTALVGAFWLPAWWLLAVVLMAYAVAASLATIHIVRRTRELNLLAIMPLLFFTIHLSYGLGSLAGLVFVAYTLFRRVISPSSNNPVTSLTS